MDNSTRAQSILDMAGGAFKERMDYEMAKVVKNILDPNTEAGKERSVTLTIKLKPDRERRQISVAVVAKSKLQPTVPVTTTLGVTGDRNGEAVLSEMTPQVPGQQAIDGAEQEENKILRLVNEA